MDITTVKLHKYTKSALDELRHNSESYDELISKLISMAKNKDLKNKLIKAYKNMGKSDLELLNDWETASKEVD